MSRGRGAWKRKGGSESGMCPYLSACMCLCLRVERAVLEQRSGREWKAREKMRVR